MAIRIRKETGLIVCAAKTEPEMGDVYIDDKLHHALSAVLMVMSVREVRGGVDIWEFHRSLSTKE